MSIEFLSEQLKCPVCYEIPAGEIFQCRFGHIVCHSCWTSMVSLNCPQCRTPYLEGYSRNRALEATITAMHKVKCDLYNSGATCPERILVGSVSNPLELTCLHNAQSIQFCKALNLGCDHAINTFQVSLAVGHFESKHQFTSCPQSKLVWSITESSLKNYTSNLAHTKAWTPVIMNFLKGEDQGRQTSQSIRGIPSGPPFIFLPLYGHNDRTMSWVCFLLGHSKLHVPDNYQVHYEIIKNKDPFSTPKLKWAAPAVGIWEAEDWINTVPFRIPVDLLLSKYSNRKESTLTLTLTARIEYCPPSSVGHTDKEASYASVSVLDTCVLRRVKQEINSNGNQEHPDGQRNKRNAIMLKLSMT